MLHCGYVVLLFLRHTDILKLKPKISTLAYPTLTHLPTRFLETYVFFAELSWAWMFVFVKKGLHLATVPHSPDIGRMLEIVFTCTAQPVLARNFCSSFNFAVSFLAASLTSFPLIFSSFLEGHPVLGNITVEPHFLHLMMTVFTGFLIPW